MKKIYTGGIDLGDEKVVGVAAGTTSTDAVNKGQLDTVESDMTTYVDGKIEGLGEYVSKIDPASGLPTTGSGAAGAIDRNDWWYVEAEGTFLGISAHVGDRLQAAVDNPDTADNTASNTDFLLLHTFHIDDTRHPITALVLTADVAETVNHALGYQFVNVNVADTDGKKIDVEVDYVDENNLTLTSSVTATVSGVVTM